MNHPWNHSRDLWLSLLTYANNPSPTQITLHPVRAVKWVHHWWASSVWQSPIHNGPADLAKLSWIWCWKWRAEIEIGHAPWVGCKKKSPTYNGLAHFGRGLWHPYTVPIGCWRVITYVPCAVNRVTNSLWLAWKQMWVGVETLSDMYLPQVCICAYYFSVWYLCPLFLYTKFEWVPSVNFHQMWVGTKCVSGAIIFLHEMSECPMWMCTKCEWMPSHYTPAPSVHLHLLFFSVYLYPLFSCYEISECTQCECVQNVRVCPMWMCPMWMCTKSHRDKHLVPKIKCSINYKFWTAPMFYVKYLNVLVAVSLLCPQRQKVCTHLCP